MVRKAVAVYLVLGGTAFAVSSHEVKEVDGNLFLVEKTGLAHQVTASGRDYEPSLSPDGSMIIFVRLTHEISDPNSPSAGALTRASQLWMVDLRGDRTPRLLLDNPVIINDRRFYAFHAPKLSPKNHTAYFLVDFAATTSAIIRLDVVNNKKQFIATALQFCVIATGKYKGYLVAQEHKAKLAPGYYDWFWLLTPDGKEVDVVGMDKNDVDLFLEMYGSE